MKKKNPISYELKLFMELSILLAYRTLSGTKEKESRNKKKKKKKKKSKGKKKKGITIAFSFARKGQKKKKEPKCFPKRRESARFET